MVSKEIVSLIHPVGGPALRRHLLDLLADRMAAAALTTGELIDNAARLENYVINGAARLESYVINDVSPAPSPSVEAAPESDWKPCTSTCNAPATDGASAISGRNLFESGAGAAVDCAPSRRLYDQPRPVSAEPPEPVAPVAAELPAPSAPEPVRPASLEQRLLAVLTDVIARGRACPKNRELADIVDATESDLSKAMTSLRADGRIVIERRGNLRRIGIGRKWTPWPDGAEASADTGRAKAAEDEAPADRPAVLRVDAALLEEVFQRIAAAAVDEAPFPAIGDMAELIGKPKLDVQRAVDELKTSERISVEWQIGRCRACVEGLWTDWSETAPPRAAA